MKYKYLSCQKVYSNNLDEKLKKRFKFSDNDINKFILLLRRWFIHMTTWMIEKSLMKQPYLKKKNFLTT